MTVAHLFFSGYAGSDSGCVVSGGRCGAREGCKWREMRNLREDEEISVFLFTFVEDFVKGNFKIAKDNKIV